MVAVVLGILAALAPNAVVVDVDNEPQVSVDPTCVAVVTCGAEPTEGVRKIEVRTLGPDGMRCTADANYDNVVVLSSDGPANKMSVQKVILGKTSDVWIGVRITAVPAPLAAHIGEDGVMIANVVKDSPADEAGLRQYDVVVRFDKVKIDTPHDLTEAIGATEAGQTATLSIIRQAEPLELDIVPGARPTDPVELEMKYEEPADSFFDAGMKLRGKALKIGPDGQCILEDLGELHSLPDMLKELEDLDLDLDIDLDIDDFLEPHTWHFGDDDDVKILKRLQIGPGCRWFGDDDEKDVEITIEIREDEDGESLTIRTDRDGKIHVTRVDEDGKETAATYENPEDFAAADPEAFEVYAPHMSGQGLHFIHLRPFGKQAQKLRKEFQFNVQQRIKEALEQFEKAREGAQRQHEDVLRHHKEALKDAHEALKKALEEEEPAATRSDRRVEVHQKMLGVRIDDSGAITVRVNEDGELATYKFESKEAFQEAEPELYEKVKDFLE